jgi:hypothetical protein
MSNWLLDALGDVGYALDTPGAYTRGLLAGRPGERASGEEMLSSYGVDAGPWGGLAAEVVVDPLTLLPPLWGAYKGTRALGKGIGLADDAAPLARRLGELGSQLDPMERLRYGYRAGPGRISSLEEALGEPIAGGLWDETGAFHVPRRPDSEAGLRDWTKGIQGDYAQALGDTQTPAGRLKALADTAGVGVYGGGGDDPLQFLFKTGNSGAGAIAKYTPGERLIVPNMNWHPEAWLDNARMNAVVKSNKEAGHLATGAKDQIAIHEIGHGLHQKYETIEHDPGFFEHLDKTYPLDDEIRDLIRKDVSSYGATNPTEFVAEMFTKEAITRAMTGRSGKLASGLYDRYFNLGGPHPRKDFLQKIKEFMLQNEGSVDPDVLLGKAGGLFRESPLDRRLGELGSQLDPMDRLRFDYRKGPGGINPLEEAVGRFGEDEAGVLDMDAMARMFGGDRRAAQVAAVQGPGYPGGPGKIADMLSGNPGDEWIFRGLMKDPAAAKFLASEVPEGSRFLGAGVEAGAFATPYDSVVRVNQRPMTAPLARLDIPEMLQPFRSVHKGGYTVEHLPMMRPAGRMVDDSDLLEGLRDVANPNDPLDVAAMLELYGSRERALRGYEDASERVIRGAGKRDIEVADWGTNNVGLTREGDMAAFDPGALEALDPSTAPFGVPLQADAPVDFRRAVRQHGARAGAPDYIREALERDASLGGSGQGVYVPEMAGVRRDTDLMEHMARMLGHERVGRPDWEAFRDTIDLGMPTETASEAYARMVRSRDSQYDLLDFLLRGR